MRRPGAASNAFKVIPVTLQQFKGESSGACGALVLPLAYWLEKIEFWHELVKLFRAGCTLILIIGRESFATCLSNRNGVYGGR
jgi:hypothetical protein